MKISALHFRALTSCAAVAMLAACGGSQPPIGAPLAFQRASEKTSWVAPDASSIKKLVYVSSLDQGVVQIYNYNTGTQVGRLSGFWNPQGQCVDAKGDVYIADYSNLAVAEYAHGGRKPIKTLQTDGSPIACSVSPDGDLAVVYSHTSRSNQAEIVIFKDASGTPTVYKDRKCYYLVQPGYDHEGNLYVQADTYSLSSEAGVCEIPKGGKSMKPVSSNADVVSPLGLMWDGKHITLSGESYTSSTVETIYQMKETASGGLTVVSKTALSSPCNNNTVLVAEPFIVGAKNTPANTQLGKAVVGADAACSRFDFWAYPKGGAPFRGLNKTFSHIAGQSVSIAP